ncbi:hypothetical protein AGMMS49525_00300 [Bacteroidia bacterium]|nr:hypothetical protein AGMMS49525_00300 [Bacteroidia bacterium]
MNKENILSPNSGLSLFESIKHVDENGNEYWDARALAKTLEYSEYRHFIPVVNKAKESCENSSQVLLDHFEDVLGMIIVGKGAERQVDSIKLSR